MNMLVLLAVVATALVVDGKSAKPIQCYQCITRNPSWAVEKCKPEQVQSCALGNYCTKASFGGNSLVIRGCAPGGPEKEFPKDGKLCKKTDEFMKSTHVSDALKNEFNDVKILSVFYSSCPGQKGKGFDKLLNKVKGVGHKQPRKGFTCKKKLCNAGGRIDATAVVVMAAAVAAIFATKQ